MISKGDEQSFSAYEKLGETGNAEVLYNLTKFYDGSSRFMFPELEKAYMYAYLAHYRGHPKAREELQDLKQSFMTDSMIDKAQELARDFYNRHGEDWY